jgi:WD40 repeat protein
MALLESEALQSEPAGWADGFTAESAGTSFRPLQVCDLSSGNTVGTTSKNFRGRVLALGTVSGDLSAVTSSQGYLHIWDVSVGASRELRASYSSKSGVSSALLGSIGQRDVLVAGTQDGVIKAWDIHGREKLEVNVGSTIQNIRVADSGRIVVSTIRGIVAIELWNGNG